MTVLQIYFRSHVFKFLRAAKKSHTVFAKRNRWGEISDAERGRELLYVMSPHSELIYEDNQSQNTLCSWVNEDNKTGHASDYSTGGSRACLHCSHILTLLLDGRLGIKITKREDSAEVPKSNTNLHALKLIRWRLPCSCFKACTFSERPFVHLFIHSFIHF